MEDTQNRDYNNADDFWNKQVQIYKTAYVCIALLAINVLVFLACPLFKSIYTKGVLSVDGVLYFKEWYRIITSVFLHADLEHILANMLMLVFAGAIVERHAGHLYFGVMFMASAVVGNILSLMYDVFASQNRYMLGASGGTMGIIGYLAFWLFANKKDITKNRNLLFRMALLAAYVIDACFLRKEVNTTAHLGGFITGFILGYINVVIMNNNKDMEGLA